MDGLWVTHHPLTRDELDLACDMAKAIGGPVAMLIGGLKAERAARIELITKLYQEGLCVECAKEGQVNCDDTCLATLCCDCYDDHVCVDPPRLNLR